MAPILLTLRTEEMTAKGAKGTVTANGHRTGGNTSIQRSKDKPRKYIHALQGTELVNTSTPRASNNLPYVASAPERGGGDRLRRR